jgi:Uma2 family endonuclease
MDLDDFEEYAADKPEHEKWELIGGRVIKLMVGPRWSHHRLVQNIAFHLTSSLRSQGSPCLTYTETFWLKEHFLRLALFPDVMVHCGRPDRNDVAFSDPTVLFEVVSPGSEQRDLVEKAELYRRLHGLRHLVFVSRDRPAVTLNDRSGERAWSDPRPIYGLESVLPLPAINVDLPLAEIYRDVIEAQRDER